MSLAADFGGFDLAGLSDSPQGQLLMQAFPIFTEMLASAIRRITLDLWWMNGNERLEFKVVMFLTDPARVANPLGGGLPGQTTTGQPPPGTSTGDAGQR